MNRGKKEIKSRSEKEKKVHEKPALKASKTSLSKIAQPVGKGGSVVRGAKPPTTNI